MRRSDWLSLGMALVGGGLAASLGACVFNFDTGSCDDYPKPGCPGVAGTTTTGGTGGTSGTTGTGGTTGTTTTPTIDCSGDPAPVVANIGNIRDECAVFVKAGALGGDGSMMSPVSTIAEALGKTGGARKKVYVCTPTQTPLLEAVSLDEPDIEVFGGFDCSKPDWTWAAAARSSVRSPADKVAWTVTSAATGTLVSGLDIRAASPSDPFGGGDSIGMAIADVVVTIRRCDVTASNGARGADGAVPTDPVTAGANAPAVDPLQANACINAASLTGGTAGATMCDGVDTSGGPGGKGGITGTASGNGTKGGNGFPTPASGSAGQGGQGQTDLVTLALFCTPGNKGLNGGMGTKGTAGQALGTLTLTGLLSSNGGDGSTGIPGQGGGGGGGSKAGMFCAGGVDGNGASGGGGGAGGCGGKGGKGGQSGGSSIAIVSLGTKLLIDGMTVTLTAGEGGEGGKGSSGQAGGGFGAGAAGGAASGISPSRAGCTGGNGGYGGDGGPGGGGRGGHSIGIVFPSAPPASLIFKTAPSVEMPGTGGKSNGGNVGDAGQAGKVCDFSKSFGICT